MSKYSNVDGLGHYHDPEPEYTHLQEAMFEATCEAVTDEQIEEWLAGMELDMTIENIEKAVTDIALHKLGWDR